MEYVRSFIAIDLPENIRSELRRLQEHFKKSFHRFKWVSVTSIHLTLKFLGNVTYGQLDPIKKELQKIAEEQPAFRLSLRETGLFPDMRRPRVVWVGLGDDIKALSQLQLSIDSALTPLGFVPEKRDFTPHLTLARIPEGLKSPEPGSFGKQWASVQINTNLNFMATSVNLMKSTLRPAGAIYDVLASFYLKSL